MSETPTATYERIPPAAKALLAELEDNRRSAWAQRRDNAAERQVYAADYVIRAVTGDVLADDDVKQLMEHAFEEVV